jgi:hypothetical protein
MLRLGYGNGNRHWFIGRRARPGSTSAGRRISSRRSRKFKIAGRRWGRPSRFTGTSRHAKLDLSGRPILGGGLIGKSGQSFIIYIRIVHPIIFTRFATGGSFSLSGIVLRHAAGLTRLTAAICLTIDGIARRTTGIEQGPNPPSRGF